MKQLIYFALLFFLGVSAFAQTAPNTLDPVEKEEGFQLLFDGKGLSPEIWQSSIEGYPVENGEIVCRKGGNLLTAKEYGDFVFRFEFALPPGGNNGVGIRAESPSKDAAYHGMEIQVLDDTAEKYSKLKEYQYHGSIYGIVPAKRGFQKPLGEWNLEEITACGSRITVKLNGETIVDADLAEFKDKPLPDGKEHPGLFRKKGFIGFLGHGDPVRFRNVRIKELNTLTDTEKKDGFTLLFDGKTVSPEIWQGDIAGYPVENDVIVCRGGNLMTKEDYNDFIFRCEFKVPPGGNNGIGIRSPGVEAPTWNGLEIQILDHFHPKYKDLKEYQFHGSVYGVIPAKRNAEKNDSLKPVGDWNFTEISAIGTKLRVVLNGETIVDADLQDYRDKPVLSDIRPKGLDRLTGLVGFLGHSDPVEFRNVRIKRQNAN